MHTKLISISKLVLFSLLAFFLNSCDYTCSTANKDSLISVDLEFSAYSKSHGVNNAFLKYAHDSAVILRSNSYPCIGKINIKKLYSKPDSSFTLTWEPSYANISKSGDLGYTYGIYTFQTNDTTTFGTYVSIWQKTNAGWKYILDTGNSGLKK